ncbi:MAG: tripartite tricarboxylate transporter substrate binding protein [Burkholderiales bacterium]|nr:tripartite tricarboxylate transporter substrate binding protein [Burkholderiales bacterium]
MKSLIAVLAAATLAVPAAQAQQSWSPSRNVEIVVGSAPGGSNDKTARAVERAIVEGKLIPTSLTVVNRPGGGSSIAFNYVNQRKGDPHTLLIGTTALLTNHIVGTSPLSYMDFTPVASLFNDYVVFAVNANSPIKTGKDLIARLKENPQSVALGFATTLGSHNHIAAGLLAKSIGVNARNLKAIAFKGSAEAITQLLGGHIDLVTTAAGNVAGHVAEGRLRVVGVSADKRFPGAFAQVPTWKEQGANLVYGGWRAIMAPKDITPAQIAYWEGVLRKAASNPDWKADLEKNYWSDDFVGHAQFSKDIAKDYNDIKAVLVDIGLAKQ